MSATTELRIENPSATHPLKLSTQALSRPAEEISMALAWVDAPGQAAINGRERLRINPQPGQRLVLAVDGVANIRLEDPSRPVTAFPLVFENDEWSKADDEPKVLLKPNTESRVFALTETRRLAVTSDDEAALTLINLSDVTIKIVTQTVGRQATRAPPSTWGSPVDAGMIAAGGKGAATIHDTARLIVRTPSPDGVLLAFMNTNPVHAMRLQSLSSKGEIESIDILQKAALGETRCAVIAINHKVSAIITQLPT